MVLNYDNNINIFLIVPLALFLFIAYAYFITKKRTKSIQFKIALLIGFIPVIVSEFAALQFNTFQNSVVTLFPFFGIALVLTLFIIYYIVKILNIKDLQINKNTSNLEKIIDVSSDSSLNVANIATELAASASEVNAASEEISATTLEINTMAQDQVKELDTMYKMANDIKNIANVITNISEQTNLLALNASIEAGRAGEHGRGFAVVAEKVQKLAEESKKSVDETSSLIEIINTNISKLTENSKKLSIIIEGISASAEEQTASMEEITSTATRLGALSEELKQNLLMYNKGQIKK